MIWISVLNNITLLCFVLFMKMTHVSTNLTEHGMEGGVWSSSTEKIHFQGQETTQPKYSDCEQYDFPADKAIETWNWSPLGGNGPVIATLKLGINLLLFSLRCARGLINFTLLDEKLYYGRIWISLSKLRRKLPRLITLLRDPFLLKFFLSIFRFPRQRPSYCSICRLMLHIERHYS